MSDYQEYLAWTYFGAEAFDRSEFERFASLLDGASRFIDVGASHGVYSYHANRILRGADIVCIEADPERFAILQHNTAKWAAESTNRFHCVHAAASDQQDRRERGTITFYTTGTQISGGLFTVVERSDDYRPVSVPVVCVDDFFESGAETFVKIDVEGSELRVLQGAVRHIEAGQSHFFTEISWWGDRARRTSSLDVLRFALASGMRVDRRLRSDYLLSPEPRRLARLASVLRCLPPLSVRFAWNRFVPAPVRLWRERRQNRRRMSRFRPPAERS